MAVRRGPIELGAADARNRSIDLGALGPGDVQLASMTPHGWRVSDTRLPSYDTSRLLAFVELLNGVRDLPGVTRVFSATTGISRWFDEPITAIVEDGPSVIAWVTVGLDRHTAYGGIVGMIGAYVRARLTECGFDLIEVRVRVVLFD